MTADRYDIVKARPDGDPLGDSDRLIVDRDMHAVMGLVYDPKLAELVKRAWEDNARMDVEAVLGIGPRGLDGKHALTVSTTEAGYVEFEIVGGDRNARIIREEVERLHAQLGQWLTDNGPKN